MTQPFSIVNTKKIPYQIMYELLSMIQFTHYGLIMDWYACLMHVFNQHILYIYIIDS